MIICFSGTGNSRIVADRLQEILGDEIVRFAPGLMLKPERVHLSVYDERVIWVFPVHGWNIPQLTREVIKKATISAIDPVNHYMVCTCGDDIGRTHIEWRKLMAQRGWSARSAFSVQMPNTYVILKGFDVDSPEVTQAKLQAMPGRVAEIANFISEHPLDVTDDVVAGSWAWAKTAVLNPLFRTFLFSYKGFHTTDGCKGCGLCARNCPIRNITIEDGRPRWHNDCLMCLRCYHICPSHAVRYGKQSEGKGQYLAPGYILNQ